MSVRGSTGFDVFDNAPLEQYRTAMHCSGTGSHSGRISMRGNKAMYDMRWTHLTTELHLVSVGSLDTRGLELGHAFAFGLARRVRQETTSSVHRLFRQVEVDAVGWFGVQVALEQGRDREFEATAIHLIQDPAQPGVIRRAQSAKRARPGGSSADDTHVEHLHRFGEPPAKPLELRRAETERQSKRAPLD